RLFRGRIPAQPGRGRQSPISLMEFNGVLSRVARLSRRPLPRDGGMASKVASVADTAETREDAAEAPLLDQTTIAIKKMMARGKERGYLTYDELNAALPTDQLSPDQIEDVMTQLSELGINVIENEDAEEPAAAESEDGEAEARGNLDDDDIGRTDDPVRMY